MGSDTWPEEKSFFADCLRSENIPGSNVPHPVTSLLKRPLELRAK